jgi:predicted nucleotidyltransferase
MTTLQQIRSQREAILAIAKRHGAKNVRLFGSVVRAEDRPDSDLDVLVEFESGRSLLDLAGQGIDLEELLGRKVDVVTDGAMSPYMGPSIRAEATPL